MNEVGEESSCVRWSPIFNSLGELGRPQIFKAFLKMSFIKRHRCRCHIGSYAAPNYLPQVMQSNSQQQVNNGYFSPMYHPLLTNTYHATVNASPAQTVYGSGSLPSLDHVMHLRSQLYNENQASQNSMPCYMAVTSSSRDTGNSSMKRQDLNKAAFIN